MFEARSRAISSSAEERAAVAMGFRKWSTPPQLVTTPASATTTTLGCPAAEEEKVLEWLGSTARRAFSGCAEDARCSGIKSWGGLSKSHLPYFLGADHDAPGGNVWSIRGPAESCVSTCSTLSNVYPPPLPLAPSLGRRHHYSPLFLVQERSRCLYASDASSSSATTSDCLPRLERCDYPSSLLLFDVVGGDDASSLMLPIDPEEENHTTAPSTDGAAAVVAAATADSSVSTCSAAAGAEDEDDDDREDDDDDTGCCRGSTMQQTVCQASSTTALKPRVLPRTAASLAAVQLGPGLSQLKHAVPFGSEHYFDFLRSLAPPEFTYLARTVARYRRRSRLDATPSTIVSINLCGCDTPHPGPVSLGSFQDKFWTHATPEGGCPPGAFDTKLSVMLVELHADLGVTEFLERRLPAVVRQQVGNRLDRNFVVQVFGVSFLRGHLVSGKWLIGDLPECTSQDMDRLRQHPLYQHMLMDISARSEIPTFRNLNLCPIKFSPNRPWPTTTTTQSSTPSPSSGLPAPSSPTHQQLSSHTLRSSSSLLQQQQPHAPSSMLIFHPSQ